MAKDNNESTPKLTATVVQQLRKLAAGHEHQFRKFAADIRGYNFGGIPRKTLTPGERISTDEIGNSVSEELARLRELITEKMPAAPPPPAALSRRKKRKPDGREVRRIRQELPKLFPPDGRVPDHVATAKVCARIEAECGWKAKWDSVARALRRRKE